MEKREISIWFIMIILIEIIIYIIFPTILNAMIILIAFLMTIGVLILQEKYKTEMQLLK